MDNLLNTGKRMCPHCGRINTIVYRDTLNKTTQKFLGLDKKMDVAAKAQVCRTCGHVIVEGTPLAHGNVQPKPVNHTA